MKTIIKPNGLSETRWVFDEFTGLLGKCQMEIAVADILNKAHDDCCLFADVHFEKSDVEEGFEDLVAHGWIEESHGKWKPTFELVRRIHSRYKNV